MLGKNLHLEQFVQDPAINNINLLGPLGEVHIDTIALSWICMGGILAVSLLVSSSLTAKGPGGKLQAVAEMLYGFINDLVHSQIGHHYKKFFPLIFSIFIFVLVGNFIGIGPWRAFEHMHGWPTLHDGEPFEICSPTTDFNVTLALAMLVLVVYLAAGFAVHGIKYGKLLVFNPIEWLDLVVRPATLAMRLMVVITADELMRAAFLGMMPVILPSGIMGFEMFIGFIQAMVFALLSSVYIGLTVSEHH